jgi:hypothetical protein
MRRFSGETVSGEEETMFCPHCRLEQPETHVFCPLCGTRLPVQLLANNKASRFFPAVKVSPDDPENAYLRVSCYLKRQEFTSPEGSVSFEGRHVRFSVWTGDEARCVLSISETEANELATFIHDELARLGSEPAEPLAS